MMSMIYKFGASRMWMASEFKINNKVALLAISVASFIFAFGSCCHPSDSKIGLLASTNLPYPSTLNLSLVSTFISKEPLNLPLPKLKSGTNPASFRFSRSKKPLTFARR